MAEHQPEAWQLLGVPESARVLIIHCDDLGMNHGANVAGKAILERGIAKSGSIMVPCAWAYDMAMWAIAHPDADIGLHITHNSEWETYKWRTVAERSQVPELCYANGFMRQWPRDIFEAPCAQFEAETRAQIDQALLWGWRPSHLDTHCATAVMRPDLAQMYMGLSQEYGIPALTVKGRGPEGKAGHSPWPSFDYVTGTDSAASYEALKAATLSRLRSLPAGAGYLVLHPNDKTTEMLAITDSAEHRAWEYRLLMDDDTEAVIRESGIVVTSWRELAAAMGNRG